MLLCTAGLLASPASCSAAASSPLAGAAAQDVQQAYDRYSATYDDLDGSAAANALGFPQLRQELVGKARGQVLEVAVGTGLNLPYYQWEASTPSIVGSSSGTDSSGVSTLTAVDLSTGMLQQAQQRAQVALPGRSVEFKQADVGALPFPDSSFDSVVDTFSLCVFPDPQAALAEVARVVRPAPEGGRVLLVEHARSDSPLLAAYQDATASAVAAMGKGCVWNQDVEALVRGAGLQVVRAERSGPGGTIEVVEAVKGGGS